MMKNRNVVNQLPSKDEWETPEYIFDKLNEEFSFNFDLACTSENCKCEDGMMFDKGMSGLDHSIDKFLNHVDELNIWCNPPYSQLLKDQFIAKCSELIKEPSVCVCVMLLPASTDTKIFHKYIYNKPNVEIRFLKGRVKFKGVNTKGEYVTNKCGMTGSMVVIFRK